MNIYYEYITIYKDSVKIVTHWNKEKLKEYSDYFKNDKIKDHHVIIGTTYSELDHNTNKVIWFIRIYNNKRQYVKAKSISDFKKRLKLMYFE